jgi:ABC-type nitrate/sulfonate/bicarbonate transport system permease component
MAPADSSSRSIWLGAASVIGVLGVWQGAADLAWIDSRFFPPPAVIFLRIFELLGGERNFLTEVGYSLMRLFAGAVIAIPAAVATALLAETRPVAGGLLRPWIGILYPVPKLAIFPLLLILFGIGETSRIAMVAIGVFFLVLLNSMQGIRRIRCSEYYEIASVYRIPPLRLTFRILLQGALPEILSGCKMGVGYGLVMVVAAEFTASRYGLGVFIWNSWDQFRIIDLYSGIFVIGALGVVLFWMLDWIAARFARYD